MLLGQLYALRHGLATLEGDRRQRRYVREELIEQGLADLADAVVVRAVIDLDPAIGMQDPSLKFVEARGDADEVAVEPSYLKWRPPAIIWIMASRVGLTPSPTCLPGQGGSCKGMRPFGNETGRTLLGQTMEGFLMSDRASGLSNEGEAPFVDPWSHGPNHQGAVPVDAVFVGSWDIYIGVDDINEALFLVRSDRQDLLWSVTSQSEEETKENLAARESGDPAWVKHELICGCVAGSAREGTQKDAAIRLLKTLARARQARSPYLPGLLASDELSSIANAAIEEWKRNRLAAEATQRREKAQIVEVASELGLNPRPAGHNDSAWIADCPRRTHTLMLSPSLNEFGCGYCRRKGDIAELRTFVGSFAVTTTDDADWFDYPDWSDRERG
jgi:hypothetical protein